MDISREAKSAVINAQGSGIGERVYARPEHMRELQEAGYVGPKGGLTVKGSVLREREMERALNF